MRVRLSIDNLRRLFKKTLEKIGTRKNVALRFGVSIRALSNWKCGKSTIPFNVFRKLALISGLKEKDISFRLLPDSWHIKNAASKGARSRMKLYGNFGTPEGRRKGGLVSIESQKNKRGSNFKTLKSIRYPKQSGELAELMGILFGDGHLSKYQVSITTNSKTDVGHALFSCNLIKKLFNITPAVRKKIDENTISLISSSKNMVKFLHKKGMPIGNKIQNHLSAPGWIFKNVLYQKAFIRGLFDTDGCVYLDIHRTSKKTYKHLGWTITSYADKLRVDITTILGRFGLSPTCRLSQKSIYLRKQREIVEYFMKIGTNNPKHYQRFKKFTGGVPKWS